MLWKTVKTLDSRMDIKVVFCDIDGVRIVFIFLFEFGFLFCDLMCSEMDILGAVCDLNELHNSLRP